LLIVTRRKTGKCTKPEQHNIECAINNDISYIATNNGYFIAIGLLAETLKNSIGNINSYNIDAGLCEGNSKATRTCS